MSRNQQASPEALNELADFSTDWIYEGVMDNPNTSLETIVRLAKKHNYSVEYVLERNPNIHQLLTEYAQEHQLKGLPLHMVFSLLL